MKAKGLRPAAVAAIGVVAVVAGAVSAPPAVAAAKPKAKVYKGTAAMTVKQYDYCGGPWGAERRYLGQATYKLPATLTVSPTQKAGRQSEKNPFHFSLTAGAARTNGSVMLYSSVVLPVSPVDLAGHPRDPRLLLRYWKYTRKKSGAFSGKLADTHKSQAAVLNTFNAATLAFACRPSMGYGLVTPRTINAGAKISGKITAGKAQVTVTGGTYDGFFSFRLDFKKK
ncbi:hypothetical protein ACIQGZ_12540 [Streptomyces sp. NPDC092296]|uniref:hypothetical protein n=1 Tax=Streptomyces sp. NPDC092296 TaxID=3366012 RepID=UPI003813F792